MTDQINEYTASLKRSLDLYDLSQEIAEMPVTSLQDFKNFVAAANSVMAKISVNLDENFRIRTIKQKDRNSTN